MISYYLIFKYDIKQQMDVRSGVQRANPVLSQDLAHLVLDLNHVEWDVLGSFTWISPTSA